MIILNPRQLKEAERIAQIYPYHKKIIKDVYRRVRSSELTEEVMQLSCSYNVHPVELAEWYIYLTLYPHFDV